MSVKQHTVITLKTYLFINKNYLDKKITNSIQFRLATIYYEKNNIFQKHIPCVTNKQKCLGKTT